MMERLRDTRLWGALFATALIAAAVALEEGRKDHPMPSRSEKPAAEVKKGDRVAQPAGVPTKRVRTIKVPSNSIGIGSTGFAFPDPSTIDPHRFKQGPRTATPRWLEIEVMRFKKDPV